MTLHMTIDETDVDVAWEENQSVEALRALCQSGPLTITMSRYGGFEQVGPIGQRLPSSDSQMTRETKSSCSMAQTRGHTPSSATLRTSPIRN